MAKKTQNWKKIYRPKSHKTERQRLAKAKQAFVWKTLTAK